MTQQTEIKSISEILDIAKGKKVKILDHKTKSSIPYLLIDTLRGEEPEFFTEDKKYTEANEQDILMVFDGANSGLVGTGLRGAVGSTIARLRPKKDIYSKYITYFLSYNFSSLNQDVKGSAIPHIKPKKLLDLKIRYPSKEEQSLIVSAIETQFTRLEEAVKVLKSVKDKLRIYKKTVLKKAFDVKLKKEKIGDICIINPSKTEVKNLDENFEVSFIPMAYVSEEGKIISMDKRPLKEVNKGFTFFKNGDVLLAKITPCFENGKKAIAEGLTNGIGFGTTEFYVLRPQEKVISKWLFYNVSREDFRALAKRSMGGVVGQQRVSKTMIENFEVPVPSIEEQKKIIQKIESKFSVIEKVEQVVNQSLIKAEKLRKSILKSAFEGKLVKIEGVEE